MCLMPFILAWLSMATPMLCQSGEWGSGLDTFPEKGTNNTIQAVSDEPDRTSINQESFTPAAPSSPTLQDEPQLDRCAVHFSTLSLGPKADREQLAHMQSVQRGNKAVIDNLMQFVGAELGEQRYEDVIKENIISVQEDQKTCHRAVEEAEDDMQEQLKGQATGTLVGMET